MTKRKKCSIIEFAVIKINFKDDEIMKIQEDIRPHYLREYRRVLGNTFMVTQPVTDELLKYDEKTNQPSYVELSEDVMDALREMLLLFAEPVQNGRLQ